MKRIVPMIILILLLITPVSAAEITAPMVPQSGAEWMPENTASFPESLMELLYNVLPHARSDIRSAVENGFSILLCVLAVSILHTFSDSIKSVTELTGTLIIAGLLIFQTGSMVELASDTVTELSEYGKLLCPVLATAVAAQGGLTTSTALYAGTTVFSSMMSSLISRLLVPMVYFYLAVSVANGAMREDVLKKIRDMIKKSVNWCLKTLLTIFTTYMGLTGVISGTTDAVALKATKAAISTVVPVVGGILSNASEAVLISAAMVKNAAGIYGIIAILAVFLHPFLKISIHYVLLKMTAMICELFGVKSVSELIDDFSVAMGILLGMTASICFLLLISTVCFMRGVGQ